MPVSKLLPSAGHFNGNLLPLRLAECKTTEMATRPVECPSTPEAKAKIAIFLPSLEAGGAERAMVVLANGIADRGYPVDMILCSARGPFLREVSLGVQIVDLGVSRVSYSVGRLAHYLQAAQPRALLSAMTHANLVALAAGRATGTRVIVSERNSRRRTLKDWTLRLMARLAYRGADAVVAVSGGIAAKFNATAIPNPIDLAAIRAKSQAQIPAQAPFILAAGRLVPQKDFASLIRAYALANPPERLIILGEGPERPALERLVAELGLADCVALPGFDPNPFAYMARARLFVLSSRYEGLPGVLIQAMACGCPVVAADCPTGPREILEGGRWGDLVPVGDVPALAGAITAALARDVHPDVARRAADYDEANVIDRYLEVLLPSVV